MEEKDMPQNDSFMNGNGANIDMNINSDDNIPGTSHLNDPMTNGDDEENADNETQKLKAELQEQKDKYLRLFAEFDNAKRRTAKERLELMQTAGKEIIVSLLDALDDSERAEKQLQTTDDVQQIKEGLSIVFNKLRNILQSKGLKSMESIGQDFDVEKHDAITEIPAPNPALVGKVVDEVTKGYYLNDKIIRHAKVIVGK
ncbi:MAG: nucleotide exchange factor GrpE [Chitinophagaceae bacterium]|nr:nucleotide exchange factor GrpE [Chitinophagaceae bacterium]